jgi:DNA repair protein RadD
MAKQRILDFVVEVAKPVLRPYQLAGVAEMQSLVAQGVRRILLTMPTGGGKTVLASHIIDLSAKHNCKVLFNAHRIELINQTAIQLAKFGVTDIGVIKANDNRSNADARVQIASIDSLRNREKPEADIVFIDECHRAMADSYKQLFAAYPNALHIGLTATPFRTDNQGLGGDLYQALVVCAVPSQLITDGFIVCPRIFSSPAPDLSDVSYSYTTHDFHNGQLATTMMKGKLMGNIVSEWKERCQNVQFDEEGNSVDIRTVVFCVNVAHSKALAQEFRDEGINAMHIDGTTAKDVRTGILQHLENGDISVVTNVDVLCEGWDQPSVKCVVLARPTQSARMHLQQAGRCLRPYMVQGISQRAIILDHAGNMARHGLPQEDRQFTLDTGEKRNASGPNVRVCKECYAMFSGSTNTCPECKAIVQPSDVRAPIETDATVNLIELDTTRILTKDDAKRVYFIKQIERCRLSGMKPGKAGFDYKEKYGSWPPWAWSQHANALYASDANWQKLCEDRAAVRQHWEQRTAERTNTQGPKPNQEHEDGYTKPVDSDEWQYEYAADDEIPF